MLQTHEGGPGSIQEEQNMNGSNNETASEQNNNLSPSSMKQNGGGLGATSPQESRSPTEDKGSLDGSRSPKQEQKPAQGPPARKPMPQRQPQNYQDWGTPSYQQPRPSYNASKNAMSPSATPSNTYPGASWSTNYFQGSAGSRFPHPQRAAAYGSYAPYPSGRNMPTASPNASSQSSSHSNSGEQLSKTNLYIRGLTPNTSDKDLVNLCQQYGKIISTKAIIDQNTNKCKGYGFVDFESVHAAEIAVKALQSQGVQAQMAKQQEQDPTNLYIANLPTYMTESDVESMFSPFGQVISTRILRDNSGMSRGVGFARMESKEKCDQIIQAFSGKCLAGWKEALTVKFADGGNKKKNQYQNRQWIDRSQDGGVLNPYEQGAMHNGGGQTVMTPPSMLQRYGPSTMQTPVTSYQMHSGSYFHHPASQYIVHQPGPMTPVIPTSVHPGTPTMDPNMVAQLGAQMSQLQLSGASEGVMPNTSLNENVGGATGWFVEGSS